jgi:hypothetical protein
LRSRLEIGAGRIQVARPLVPKRANAARHLVERSEDVSLRPARVATLQMAGIRIFDGVPGSDFTGLSCRLPIGCGHSSSATASPAGWRGAFRWLV